MELSDFITEVLVQIASGVRDAQKEEKGKGCIIVPEGLKSFDKMNYGDGVHVSNVIFDIALSVNEQEQKRKGINVLSSFIGGGLNKNTENISSTISRISFSVQMILPRSKETLHDTKEGTTTKFFP